MNKTERLQAILTALQSKRVVRAEDLATRFEVNIRTIYRDIRSLEEAGIPIGAESGIGYFITDGYFIPPVMFTREEAMALLVAGKFVSAKTDKKVSKAFNDAVTKIKAVLDDQKKEQWEDLDDQIVLNPFQEIDSFSERDIHLSALKNALTESRVVEMKYLTMGNEEATQRQVEPIGLCYYSQKWHLIGWCRVRQDYRDFRLDRIESLILLNERFKKHSHLTVHEYISKTANQTAMIPVTIEVNDSALKYMQNSKHEMGLLFEDKTNTGMKMTFTVFSLDYFANWLLMYGDQIEVISPVELQTKIKDKVKTLYNKYL